MRSKSVSVRGSALCALALLASAVLTASAQEKRPPRKGPDRDGPSDDVRFLFKTEVPAHPLDVVLGRPTADAVTLSVRAAFEGEGMVVYGAAEGAVKKQRETPLFALSAGVPREVVLSGLPADARCTYELRTRVGGGKGGGWKAEPVRSFHTQRAPGASFAFTLQADPHLDYNTDPVLYLRCLGNALADEPDFHIDLGDTFMTDKHRGRETAAAQYVAQRYYFGHIAHSAPLFLVLGNHDGEAGRWLDGTTDNLAVWANAQRKRNFPNPVPDAFYTGNTTPDPQAGLLQNYYAWVWGDAEFVVLDPFWYTKRGRGGANDEWAWTLGREQYDWLGKTLAESRAKFRFVFLHHLVGGRGRDSRGGVEAAPLYEWGGHDPDGTDRFGEKRPGWGLPIHDLLVKHRVSVVFHGHDHLFVKQELGGVVYQEVPQPGHPRYDNTRSAEEYGYLSGVLQGSAGHLRVRVSPGSAVVDYVRAYLPGDEGGSRRNGGVSFSYELR